MQGCLDDEKTGLFCSDLHQKLSPAFLSSEAGLGVQSSKPSGLSCYSSARTHVLQHGDSRIYWLDNLSISNGTVLPLLSQVHYLSPSESGLIICGFIPTALRRSRHTLTMNGRRPVLATTNSPYLFRSARVMMGVILPQVC